MVSCSPTVPESVHVKKKKKAEAQSKVSNLWTHLAHETPPTPLASQCFYSSDAVPDALFARLALWHPKSHMAGFAIWVSLVHREANIIIVDELAVARKVQLARACNRRLERTG